MTIMRRRRRRSRRRRSGPLVEPPVDGGEEGVGELVGGDGGGAGADGLPKVVRHLDRLQPFFFFLFILAHETTSIF